LPFIRYNFLEEFDELMEIYKMFVALKYILITEKTNLNMPILLVAAPHPPFARRRLQTIFVRVTKTSDVAKCSATVKLATNASVYKCIPNF